MDAFEIELRVDAVFLEAESVDEEVAPVDEVAEDEVAVSVDEDEQDDVDVCLVLHCLFWLVCCC